MISTVHRQVEVRMVEVRMRRARARASSHILLSKALASVDRFAISVPERMRAQTHTYEYQFE